MESSTRRINADFTKIMNLGKAAFEAYRNHPQELRTADRALLLHFRYETGCRCQHQLQDIVQMVPDASMCSVEPSGNPSLETGVAAAPSTPGSMMTGGDQMGADLLARRQALEFGDFLKEARAMKNKFSDGQVTELPTVMSVKDIRDKVIERRDRRDPKEFLELKNHWQLSEKILQEVRRRRKGRGNRTPKISSSESGM